MPEFAGRAEGRGRRVALLASRFNEDVVRRLRDGALTALVEAGVAVGDVDELWVPGAWELPVVARRCLETGRYDCLVAVGAVIRGETPHFDYVAGECARGLQALQVEFGVPIGFGVLTTDDDAQAEARAGGAHGNKGHDAARVALEMADLLAQLDAADGPDA